MPASKGDAVVSFRLPNAADLDRRAQAEGLTRSEYVRQLIASQGIGGGVWVVGYYQAEPYGIYATEIDALRARAEGYGQYVAFWPWGERPAVMDRT